MKVGQPLPGSGPQMHPLHLKCSYFVFFFCKMHKVQCREALSSVWGRGQGSLPEPRTAPSWASRALSPSLALAHQELKHT